MLVSHKKKFIYTKTVKTAGTSIELYFEPYCLDEEYESIPHLHDEYCGEHGIVGYRGYDSPNMYHQWWNHMPAKTIQQQLGDSVWDTYFKFCAIRNPYEKLISAFHFKEKLLVELEDLSKPTRSNILNSLIFANEKAFLDSLVSKSPEERFRNWLIRGGSINDRNLYLIDGKVCVDYFIRFENLLEGIQHVCAELEIPFEPGRLQKLKSGNRDTSKSLDDYYDAETVRIVLEKHRFELDYFGYLPPKRFIPNLIFIPYGEKLHERDRKLIQYQNELCEAKDKLREAKDKLREVRSEIDYMNSALTNKKRRLKQFRRQTKNLQSRLERLSLRLQKKDKRLTQYKLEIEEIKSSKIWKIGVKLNEIRRAVFEKRV